MTDTTKTTAPTPDPALTPIEILLVPARAPGHWRARVTGKQPDGTTRTVTREGFCDEQPFDTAPMVARLAVGRWLDEAYSAAAGQPLDPEGDEQPVRWHDEVSAELVEAAADLVTSCCGVVPLPAAGVEALPQCSRCLGAVRPPHRLVRTAAPACDRAEAAYRDGTIGELTAFLRGAEAVGEMLAGYNDGSELDLEATRWARGIDALVWLTLRGRGRLDVARVLLGALRRLDGPAGERWARAGDVLAGLPKGWTRDAARGALAGWFGFNLADDDEPEETHDLTDLILVAYPPTSQYPQVESDAEALVWAAKWIVGGVAQELHGDGAQLLTLYRLICEEAGVDVIDPAVLRAPSMPLEADDAADESGSGAEVAPAA